MKNLILTLIITLPLTLLGQGWEQTYDSGIGMSVVECSDGKFLVGCSGVLLKVDESGELIWSNNIGLQVLEIKKINEFDVGILGILGYGNESILVLKVVNENGDLMWDLNLGYVNFNFDQVDFVVDNNNNLFVVSLGVGKGDGVYLYKISNDGSLVFEKNYNEIYNEDGGGCSIIQLSDNNYMIGLTNLSIDGEGDFFVMKVNGEGDTIFTKNFNKYETQYLYSIFEDHNNEIVLTGFHENNNLMGNNHYLLKINQMGEVTDSIEFESLIDEESRKIILSNNEYIFGVTFDNKLSDRDFLLRKTNENGEIIFENSFGNQYENNFGSLIGTSDNGYLIVGPYYDVLNQYSKTYMVKTNQFGNITSTFEIPLPNPNRKLEKTINLKGQEIKPQTNTPIIEIFNDGTVEKKIVVE